MKKFLQILITSATAYLVVLYAFAAPVTTFSPNLLPISNDTYDFGSSTPQARWLTIYAQNASTTNLTAFGRLLVGGTATTTIYGDSATSTFSGGITLSGGCFKDLSGSCLSSSAGITSLNGLTGATQTFANNGYLDITSAGTIHTFNGTTSPFFGTLTASSTIRFSSLASGQLNSNGGLIYSGATTTFNSPLAYSAGAVSCSTCVVTVTGSGNIASSGGTSPNITFTGTLPIANGGTNASSFTTSGNAVYYNGTSLLTAPLGSAITIPYASTTAISSTGSAFFATSGCNVGIGTTSPNWKLTVDGNTLLGGTLQVGGLISTNNLVATKTLKLPEQSVGGTITNIATSTILLIRSFDYAITITKVTGMVQCPSGLCESGAVFNLRHGLNMGTASTTGQVLTTNPMVVNSTTTIKTLATSFADATLAASENLWIQVTDATSSPNLGNLMIRVYYDVD